eukprot:2883153-Prymnesium_polylepis.1
MTLSPLAPVHCRSCATTDSPSTATGLAPSWGMSSRTLASTARFKFLLTSQASPVESTCRRKAPV